MENEAELIRQQMTETRSHLTEKLEALEDQVASKVLGTTESVVETVENVREAVENTVHSVQHSVEDTVESVKHTFDVRRQFEEHPWAMLGGSVVVGFLAGQLVEHLSYAHAPASNGNGVAPESYSRSTGPAYVEPQVHHEEPPRYQEAPRHEEDGWGEKALEAMRPALAKLGGLAVGVTTGLIGEMIADSIPQGMGREVGKVLDDITLSLGGTPIHSSKFPS
jgi:ElaB/YqjD/DUF883 family membrane-anchored ribosome-binding protein